MTVINLLQFYEIPMKLVLFFPEENCRFCDYSATKTLYVCWLIQILIEQIKGSHSFNWIEAYQLISWITVLSANPNWLVAGFLRGAWPMLLVHKNKQPTVSPVSNRNVYCSSVRIYSIEQTNRNVPLSNRPSVMSADVKRNLLLSYLFFDICRSQLFSRLILLLFPVY